MGIWRIRLLTAPIRGSAVWPVQGCCRAGRSGGRLAKIASTPTARLAACFTLLKKLRCQNEGCRFGQPCADLNTEVRELFSFPLPLLFTGNLGLSEIGGAGILELIQGELEFLGGVGGIALQGCYLLR
jgi:hypothetical protein